MMWLILLGLGAFALSGSSRGSSTPRTSPAARRNNARRNSPLRSSTSTATRSPRSPRAQLDAELVRWAREVGAQGTDAEVRESALTELISTIDGLASSASIREEATAMRSMGYPALATFMEQAADNRDAQRGDAA